MVTAQSVASIPPGAGPAAVPAAEAQPSFAGVVGRSAAGIDAYPSGHCSGPCRGLASGETGGVREILHAVPFGLAAVWLLSPYLKARNRFLTFLGMLATMVLFTLFVCSVRRQWDGDRGPTDMLIGMAVVGLVLILAVNLAGWSCRRRYHRRRFLLWLMLWIMAGWLTVFVVMSVIARPGPVQEMATAFAIICALSFGLLLPFLLLSVASALYRERLKELLRLADAVPLPD